MNTVRFWAVVGLLSAAAVVLQSRNRPEPAPLREPISQLPNRILGCLGTDQRIDAQTLEVLGSGEFLSRVYVSDGKVPPVSLFIAYFPTQRSGVTVHSPKHCLPGSGWVFDSSQYVQLNDAVGKPHRVGEYIIQNGSDKAFVIYWYEAHGRSVASEYSAKFYLVADAIRMNRSDGALIRVITPIGTEEDTAEAKLRAEKFVAQLASMLPRFIPN